jgi:L-alanine-DL-glutamate epimerase-like enolase superfamily enzyme
MTRIARVTAYLHEAPVREPVVAAFGRMTARPALLVRVEDADGAFGWGEVWCNFPAGAGASRLRLLEQVIGPWLLGRDAAGAALQAAGAGGVRPAAPAGTRRAQAGPGRRAGSLDGSGRRGPARKMTIGRR